MGRYFDVSETVLVTIAANMDLLGLSKINNLCMLVLVVGILNVWAQYENTISVTNKVCQNNCACCNVTTCPSSYICGGNCKDGYHGGRCYNQCPGNCNKCKDHDDVKQFNGYANCTQCMDGYYVTPELYQCQLRCPSGCKQCTSDENCSECKSGFFGDACDRKCSVGCLNNECNKETGNCDPCKDNFNGSICDVCVTGKFGVDCSNDCPDYCQGKVCNMTSGDCISCINGFFGDQCNYPCPEQSLICDQADGSCKVCQRSYYGTYCNITCPEHCLNQECNLLNGSCLDGCEGYFKGHDCKTCLAGWYGIDCNLTCSEGCLNDTCNDLSGQCEHCKENFTGTSCMECTTGMTGTYCNQTCPHNCVSNKCDRYNAYCISGCTGNGSCHLCKDGFNGAVCQDCVNRRYGASCNETCASTCLHGHCDRLNGKCTQGCIQYFIGDYCDICPHGRFGSDCSRNCSETCKNRTCDMLNGRCHSCVNNYIGAFCDLCLPGFFGWHCKEVCPERCANRTCNRFEGYCEACLPSYYGKSCESQCPATCLYGLCNQTEMFCNYGCLHGYTGDMCDTVVPTTFQWLPLPHMSIIAAAELLGVLVGVMLTLWIMREKRLSNEEDRTMIMDTVIAGFCNDTTSTFDLQLSNDDTQRRNTNNYDVVNLTVGQD